MDEETDLKERAINKKIAKLAYKEISSVIEKWQSQNDYGFGIYAHWDGCITVNEELFHDWQLREE